MKNNLNKWVLYIFLFVGVVFPAITSADMQVGISGRTGTTFTGTIYCPANEKISHFELAFDTSAAARAGVPYDMYINGVKIYSNVTPGVNTSGKQMFATTTPVHHNPVDCYTSAYWMASSTSPASIRVYYWKMNTDPVYPSVPTFVPGGDRYASLDISGTSDVFLIAGRMRYANTPYYVSTSTSSGGGGGDSYVTTPNDDLITFTLLFGLWLVVIIAIFRFINLFYARK